MPSTNFTYKTTQITSDWANQVNKQIYGSDSIASLRTLTATALVGGPVYSRARTLGYYTPGDGGGAEYWLDTSDTTSADNGGTIIVDNNGGRWKIIAYDYYNVKQFGAKGDGVTDDWAVIQAAINWICGQTATTPGTGGGELYFPAGRYRITQTLSIGWGLVMRGVWGGGYPYVGSGQAVTELYFDFGTNVNQWAIDTLTFHSVADGGGRILYNEWVTSQINDPASGGFTPTYGIDIRGFVLIDANNLLQTHIPWGAVRLNGAPNSRISHLTVQGFGYSVVLGCCYGTTIKDVTCTSNWYGLVAYNANNAIVVQGQFDKWTAPTSVTVPTLSIPSWMPSASNMVSVLAIDAAHATDAIGVIIASAANIGTNTATLDLLLQHWPEASFFLNSYDNTINSLYTEDCSKFIFTTALSSFNLLNAHNFTTSSPLPYFGDFGFNSVGKINVGGNNQCVAFYKNAFGSGNPNDLTSISVINTINGNTLLIAANPRITPDFEEGDWTPGVSSSVGTITALTGIFGNYTRSRTICRVMFGFTITTNGTGDETIVVTGLPYPSRGLEIHLMATFGKVGQIVTSDASTSFVIINVDGTYPGQSSTSYVGEFSYRV